MNVLQILIARKIVLCMHEAPILMLKSMLISAHFLSFRVVLLINLRFDSLKHFFDFNNNNNFTFSDFIFVKQQQQQRHAARHILQ